ncbi:cation:dicarboxylase symporter family transporter [Sphingomonas paucimobilis]|uniref:DNA, contig: SP655 n=1 Tax=Sphingomonas paucimobilis NBRC 13935 TaxID=1219050 RepID=A0A0C9NGG1_SPHPI|nr:cation:dicarboxylase symporter family transporter [Sphingomonas paucimobilis]MDG5973556.1 cation:dicarboxylase symporter family transporter [Sphingomonas paucimobilis]QPS17891.1 cation:dicarboxylase symporter family transporter [Sphingomonas paucimobilis]GAN15302.1 putative C4-dicarboxylate transporter [Sphingomonas paucimobilis NBRC 13935]SUJ32801.1 C4-dicarboxylate transport protein [Sphingomonas paucimobilis]
MRLFRHLYVQMLLGIMAGTAIGYLAPAFGRDLGPLGIAFVKAMRMMVPPVLFCTVVEGIVRHGAARDTGTTVLRSLIVFLGITIVALGMGLAVTLVMQPGRGLPLPPYGDAAGELQRQLAGKHVTGPGDFLVRMVPDTLFSAFTAGDVLPVLFVAGLVGFGLLRIGEVGAPIVRGIEALTRLQFAIFGFLIRAAPVGAFGAIAYTVGTYGIGFIGSLGLLLATLATACGGLIVALILAVRIATGLSGGTLLRTFRDEILIVLGTSSTEVVLPRLIEKLEGLGCPRSIVGLTIPLGYSLNLAGTAVYLIVATLFLGEALNVALSPERILVYLSVMLITSKAAAGVTGSGFSALLLTLSLLPDIPVGAAAMLIAIDRFLSEIRALTSGTANVAASLLVTRWSGRRLSIAPGSGEQRH